MPGPATIRYTYQDHRSIPEDHRRHEIIDGALFVRPTPRLNHQRVALELALLMRPLARARQLGEVVGPITDHLHDELVLEPDLVFIRTDRMDIADPEGDVHGPPDLVVEILSPKSTQSYDRNLKRKRYLESGVAEVWLVDIDERCVEVWRPGADTPEVVTDVLEWNVDGHRFEIPLAEVFRDVT